jgi:glycine/D-amino acid oxidase-like deaminating enzyme
MKNLKIAVIGAGIFGLEIATTLNNAGFGVSLFEKEGSVLSRTTSNNQNRLHVGLHYPRDLETAIQSVEGYRKFVKKYPSAVRTNFKNYYGVAKEGTQTNTESFVQFANQAEISIEAVKLNDASYAGINTDLLESLWLCNEAVVDIDEYRKLALEEAKSSQLDIHLNTTITNAFYDGSQWALKSNDEKFGKFDFVVRATYGQDSISINVSPITKKIYEYQQTLVFKVASTAKTFGLTVVDGDFVTILPSGFSNDFLIYSPLPSVLNRYIGEKVPRQWISYDEDMIDESFEVVSKRASEFAPILGELTRLRTLLAIRTLEPFMSKTDKRVSHLKENYPAFYEVQSGKIDHAIEIANQFKRVLEEV